MATIDNLSGSITLSFWKRLEGAAISQLPSKQVEYDTVADAWNAAQDALETFVIIDYAQIDLTPASGHIRSIERIERGPLF